MVRTISTFLVLTALLALAPAVPAESPQPPEPVLLDLDGVPEVVIRADSANLKPRSFVGPDGKKGWVTRIPAATLAAIPAGAGPEFEEALKVLALPSPAVDGGRVFTGGGLVSQAVYALDAATGKTLWERRLGDNGPSTVAVRRRRVITNTESCTTYALDAVTGKQIWSRWLGPNISTAPGILDDLVVSAYQDDGGHYGLVAMDLAKGKRVWDIRIPEDIVSAPVCSGDRIYVTHAGGDVACFDQRGKKVWRADLDATSAPFVGPGGLFVATAVRNQVVRVSAWDGKVIWRRGRAHSSRTRRGEVETVTRSAGPRINLSDRPRPVVIENRCCLASGRDLLVLDVGTGAEVRRIRLPAGQTFATPPAILGTNLLYGTAEGLLVEINPRLAAVRRAFDVRRPITSQPVVAAGRVHFTSGNLLLGMSWGAEDGPDYPQWGGGPSRTVSSAFD